MRRFITKFKKSFRHGEKGFTLIELLVVIAILGALVAIAVPNVASFIGRGKDEAKIAEKYNVITAVSCALAEGVAGTCTEYTDITTGILANPAGGDDDPALYLLNDTEFGYTVSTTGVVAQSADECAAWD